ncbi:histidine phosphatase family protein [Levilactobacillus zymae]|uniref:Phosphoglycerate mutase n=1 Tax=Levilactobacillus zymae TaxID=267363 RepID=A0A1Y6JZZ1_9LACO|nr:histidine phosphatase family protein [Levilactobacillus zymae]KRL16319.1 phosphoglycerate mutase [Levilactobacillus zymae DSM 19395]QFR61913.1 histidine phosphatase family protein [Levilactobacillus zymae]GEO72596.1 phosphoglycerate mutase [Levilactobacillus zymae]SMS15519.1 Phosphoglycerate mutase family [Levilactobacillus zymae]
MTFTKQLKLTLSVVAIATGALALAGGSTTAQAKKKTTTKPVTIYLTRHGETTGNVMGRVQGWSDFPLTSNGLAVANNLGRGLKGKTFKAAYAGNLTRQEVTAKHALKYSGNAKVKVNISKYLREGGYGSFEGDSIATDNALIAGVYGYKNGDEMMAKQGASYWTKLQDAYYTLDKQNSQKTTLAKADRAESSKQVQSRMAKELKTIAKNTQKKGGGNVLVVSSGMSINEYLATMAKKYTGAPLKNASVTKLTYKNGKLAVSGTIGSLYYVNKGAKLAK